MAIISVDEVDTKKQEVKSFSEKMAVDIEELNIFIDEIDEVIEGLKVFFNTTGGLSQIKELENLSFNKSSVSSITEQADNISINSDTIEVSI